MSKKPRYTVTTDDYDPITTDTDDFALALSWIADAVVDGYKATLKVRAGTPSTPVKR